MYTNKEECILWLFVLNVVKRFMKRLKSVLIAVAE